MEPEEPMLDPLVALAHVAAATERIRLGTDNHPAAAQPLVLAKQLASLTSGNGRLIFGLGVGYLEPEMRAIGVPVEQRFEMSDEYLRGMKSLWYDEAPEFSGKFVRFSGVDAYPRPIQRPIPIIVGGWAPAAHRRAVHWGDGWYGFWLNPEETALQIASLRKQAERAGRELALEISVSPRGRITPEVVARYGELGVHRLVLVPPLNLPIDELEAWVESMAPGRIGAAAAPWA
jgi:probable F420-dependent oxidoreductase